MTVPKIPSSRLMAKQIRVPMKVASKTRAGMPYQRGERGACGVATGTPPGSSPALVKDGKFESGIVREQFCDLAQPLSQRRGREQRIIALAQVVVVDVEVE